MAHEHMPGTVRARLSDTVTEALRLNKLLTKEMLWPSATGSDGERFAVRIHAPAPWNEQAASLVMDLHATSRTIELDLMYLVMGYRRTRGSSGKNTVLALEAVLNLSEAAPDQPVEVSLTSLSSWCQRGRETLGEADPHRRVPRQPGHPEPRCIWCGFSTLRYRTMSGTVFCVNPRCSDEDGRRPRATVEIDPESGWLTLMWQDGIAGLPLMTTTKEAP